MRIDFMRILEHAQNENLNVDKSDLEKFLSFLKKSSNPTQFELF